MVSGIARGPTVRFGLTGRLGIDRQNRYRHVRFGLLRESLPANTACHSIPGWQNESWPCPVTFLVRFKQTFQKRVMAIKSSCKCGFSFNAKDALAGKRVKCPRCQAVVQVPSSTSPVAAAAGGTPQINKKLLDLLDDAGVRSTPKGPICAACGEEMSPTAVICINCGYNVSTGQYLETYTDDDYAEDQISSALTDGQKRLARAEREIADTPIGAEDQDFGDGADSYIIAMAGFAIFAVLVLLGLGVVLIMDSLTDSVSPGLISAIASTTIYVFCAIWITYVAFKTKPGQAVACVMTAGLFCMVFGIMQGRGTIAASVIMIVCTVVGGASWLYCYNTGVLT
jgi:hypothetical protein